MQPLVTQADLESVFPPTLVVQVFSDNGARVAGPRLPVALQGGTDEAAAILGRVPTWRDEQSLQALVAGDTSVKIAICKLVMAIGIDGKPEWFNAQGGAGQTWRRDARQLLTDMAQRTVRSPGEEGAGANEVLFPSVANARPFEFARRRGREPSGGF